MSRSKYSSFHLLMHKIGASRLGSWLSARTLHPIDRFFSRLSGGRMTISNIVSGMPVVNVTTIGARSGQPRTATLLYLQDENSPANIALVASNWGQAHYPAWYFNLKANPRATCSITGQALEYQAHEATGDEYDRLWQKATEAYLGFNLYKSRASGRHIPIMVLMPAE